VLYTHVTNSDLIDTVYYKTDGNTIRASIDYDYEDNRDLIKWVENKAGSSLDTVSKYSYVYDDLGRRSFVANEGSAFGGSGNEKHNDYVYNDRSELEQSKRRTGITPGSGTEITAEQRDYTYDNIGNRGSSTEAGGTATTYTANGWLAGLGQVVVNLLAALGNIWVFASRTMAWSWYLRQKANKRYFIVQPWNPLKSTPSFCDAIAYLRRQLWTDRI